MGKGRGGNGSEKKGYDTRLPLLLLLLLDGERDAEERLTIHLIEC